MLLSLYQKTFLIFCVTTIVGLAVFLYESHAPARHGWLERIAETVSDSNSKNKIGSAKRVIKAENCKIPLTPVMPKYFQNNWSPKSLRTMCDYEKRLATVEDEQRLVPSAGLHKDACFREVIRGKNDTAYELSKCFPLNSTYSLQKEESIIILNGTSINFEINFPLVPRVKEKMRHWETKQLNERPISVLIFGVDTVSRAHAYRSLPKSLDVMSRMGFMNFQGFHSVKSCTLQTFMSLLMGLRNDIVRKTCSPKWASPMDPCPFIWKNFSDSQYITMYLEDGNQSFNFGGQSGFTQQPTDYYSHHLFVELWRQRAKQLKTQKLPKDASVDCASNESVGEFMLRTTQRFIEKFKHIPSFAFSWLAYPFHDDIFALAGLDEPLSVFLQYLQSKDILRRTLIIFLSDHGDRFGQFSSSLESFIEIGSVPLFVRMPEALIERYPDAYKNLQENVNKFVTPFDIHHTLLHILQKDFRADTPHPPPPHPLDERSSLFVPLKPNRTCEGSNISVMDCLCNIEYNESDADHNTTFDSDKDLRSDILNYAIEKVNGMVKQSAYKDVCEKWRQQEKDNITYVRKIGQTKEVLEIIMGFSLLNKAATFDIRLKVNLQRVQKMKAINHAVDFVGIIRSNRYGNQSWCVRSATDEDKKMKGFCYCKSTTSFLNVSIKTNVDKKITELKTDLKAEIRNSNKLVWKKITMVETKLEALDSLARKKNAVIENIPEETGETPEALIDKIKDVCVDGLKMSIKEAEMVASHIDVTYRMGKTQLTQGKQFARRVMVKFTLERIRNMIFQRTRHLQNSTYNIQPDLSKEAKAKNNLLLKYRRINDNKSVKLRDYGLYVNNVLHVVDGDGNVVPKP